MKSNITISSNIYIRANDDIQRDIKYAHQITGKQRLKTLKSQYCSGTLSSFRLTEWQESILQNDVTCCNASNREATHGLVRKDKLINWEGRCEYSNCKSFSSCGGAAKFTRQAVIEHADITEEKSPALRYEWLGIENIEEVFAENEIDEESIETVPEESIIEDFKEFVKPEEFIKIAEPSAIIEAPINSKILVNAAPGSGKTYTVIKRLEHIINKELVEDLSSVLVLVYTNAAKNEISSRLESGVSQRLLPYSAINVDVCTFDSLATSYLSTIEAQFVQLDYNGRINMFNEKFVKEDFSNFEYVIVDELQDLVNERALMTMNHPAASGGVSNANPTLAKTT